MQLKISGIISASAFNAGAIPNTSTNYFCRKAKKNPIIFVLIKSRREDYEIFPQFGTHLVDGYGMT
jgi:hypothetical protein